MSLNSEWILMSNVKSGVCCNKQRRTDARLSKNVAIPNTIKYNHFLTNYDNCGRKYDCNRPYKPHWQKVYAKNNNEIDRTHE
jgi:hypothetical protein